MNFDLYDAAKTFLGLLMAGITYFVKKVHADHETLKKDFGDYKLHVSENYVKKEELQRLEDKMDDGFKRVIDRIDTIKDTQK